MCRMEVALTLGVCFAIAMAGAAAWAQSTTPLAPSTSPSDELLLPPPGPVTPVPPPLPPLPSKEKPATPSKTKVGVGVKAAATVAPSKSPAKTAASRSPVSAKASPVGKLGAASKGPLDEVLPPLGSPPAGLPPDMGLPPPAVTPKSGKGPAKSPALPGLEPPPAVPTAVPPALPPPGETAARPVFPFTGGVSADDVYMRSGPGQYYYPLGILKRDVRVQVEGDSPGGWLAVKPPEGVFGLMHRKDVTVDPDGAKGTVSAASARVYAASTSAKRQWCVMTTLKQGDPLKVLGPADDEMVRIAPPDGTRVYVAEAYVTAAGPAFDSILTKMDIAPPKPDPFIEEYGKADADLRAEMAKPVTERRYDEIAARFKDIAEKAEKPYVKQAASDRVAYLAALREQQAEVAKIVAVGQQLDKRLADIKTERAAKEAAFERERKLTRADFVATGLVAKMESMEEVDHPIKFKLVDQNNRPLVVLKSTAYDLNQYLGKIVGVRGTKTYLRDWRIYLVTVDDMEVLE